VTPFSSCFCRNTTSRIDGIVVIVTAAISGPQSVPRSPENICRPSGIVASDESLTTMRGHRNADQ
jgi:hypothetical protein